jgi:hypothetical protein
MTAQIIPIPESLPQFRRPVGLPYTCTDEMLLEAVKVSLVGGEPAEIAKLLNVPRETLRHWMGSKEWNYLKDWVWPEIKGVVHTELVGVRSKIIRQIGERLTTGDAQYDMRGELVGYRPIKARELADMLTKTSEVIHQIEKEIGGIRDDDGKISLNELAAGLKRYAQAKDVTPESA